MTPHLPVSCCIDSLLASAASSLGLCEMGSSLQVIPGNDTRVIEMMNNIARLGPEIAMSRGENLHTSGHAYRSALSESVLSCILL